MKLQDYIHYYLGYRVITTPFGGKQKRTEHGELLMAGKYCLEVKLDNWQSATTLDFDLVKPILRKLEDITEDEMIGLLQSMLPADMEDKPTVDDYSLEMFYNDDGLMVDGDIAVGADFNCVCYEGQIGVKKCGSIILFEEGKDVTRDQLINTPMAFDYLLKARFDLFKLIEKGLAIDSKTLK